MSAISSSSLAGGRNPESSYRDSSDSDRDLTPSPQNQDDSHDEYTPRRRPASSTTWTTPSQRSNTASVSSSTRTALDELYEKNYGKDSLRCLLTQYQGGLNIAHVVQRSSKPDELTLYEYCLGFDFKGFHVDSRSNLFYLKSDWHIQFDTRKWLLLPDLTVLGNTRDFVKAVITARKDPTSTQIQSFRSKWRLKSKSKYTFVPLPSIDRDPCTRRKLTLSVTLQPEEQCVVHTYPYQTLPDLECHIAPPLVVINAGPKCAGIDLDAITRNCHQTNESQQALKRRLELLCEIWALFENAKGDAQNWEQRKRGKRKWEHDEEDIERLSQSSRRTTRSQSHSSRGSVGRKSGPLCIGEARDQPMKSETCNQLTQIPDAHKRKWPPSSGRSTLTEDAVSRLGKRQMVANLNTMVEQWIESAYG